MTKPSTNPKLFIYSLILPLVWLSIGTIFASLGFEGSVGIPGHALIIYVCIIFMSWLHVRKFQRQFTNSERWLLIAYCLIWAVLLETIGLIYIVLFPEDAGIEIPNNTLIYVIGFAILINFLLIWLAFKYAAPKFINWYLVKHREAAI